VERSFRRDLEAVEGRIMEEVGGRVLGTKRLIRYSWARCHNRVSPCAAELASQFNPAARYAKCRCRSLQPVRATKLSYMNTPLHTYIYPRTAHPQLFIPLLENCHGAFLSSPTRGHNWYVRFSAQPALIPPLHCQSRDCADHFTTLRLEQCRLQSPRR
jgi:hypothetical protein